mmetsp:Transcript_10157/g.27735  ORF Transcript_10157/g.27735 Transcript_10157/m.27735 type:complete len:232 (-) Transcript_10157:135-830(-)
MSTSIPFVFRILAPKDLAIVQAVCKDWRDTAVIPDIVRDAFVHHWNLSSVADFPPQWALAATSECFVYEHLLTRSDSLASVSVRFNSTPSAIKRVNNLVSESLASRTHVFIPVSGPHEIMGKHAAFVRCPIARKNYVVLSSCAAVRHEPASLPPSSRHKDSAAQKGTTSSIAMEEKMVALFARSQRVDEATARFYLKEQDFDLRRAIRLCEEDKQWIEGDPCTCFGRLKVA